MGRRDASGSEVQIALGSCWAKVWDPCGAEGKGERQKSGEEERRTEVWEARVLRTGL